VKLPVYLDYNATTSVAPEVADAIMPFLREQFGNPSSSHVYGQRAMQAVAEARRQGATPGEIVFTGSATEANNLALFSVAGAGQEHGLRPGTGCVPLIVGLGVAARLAGENPSRAQAHLRHMRELLHALLQASVPDLRLNGHSSERLPNTLNVSFLSASGRELLQDAAADVVASVGSACHADSQAVSGVLAALGVNPSVAAEAVRLSVGVPTTKDEIEHAAAALAGAWLRHTRKE